MRPAPFAKESVSEPEEQGEDEEQEDEALEDEEEQQDDEETDPSGAVHNSKYIFGFDYEVRSAWRCLLGNKSQQKEFADKMTIQGPNVLASTLR